MARLEIDTGTLGNPATGDTLRTAMTKVNSNFTELYDSDLLALVGGLIKTQTTNGDIKLQPNGTGSVEVDRILFSGDDITSLVTNGSINITGNGSGSVGIEGMTFTGNVISSESNADINITPSGTGKVIIDASEVELHHDGTKVLDTSSGLIDITGSLFITAATPTITLKRTNNANQPAITFKGSGGTDGANIKMDGTSGTTNELIFQTHNGSSLTETFRVKTGGAKVTGNLTLDDSDEIKLGTSGDLRIFHNGTHSIIREDGTGSLYLQSDNNVILSKDTSTEIMVKGIADGAVELYHDNVKKLETTSDGAKVTGTLNIDDGISITDNIITTSASNANLELDASGTGNVALARPIIMASFTTTQRDALTAANGMIIYNTTTNQFEGYENGAWVSLKADTADAG